MCGGGREVREVCVWWRERGEGGMCVHASVCVWEKISSHQSALIWVT